MMFIEALLNDSQRLEHITIQGIDSSDRFKTIQDAGNSERMF